MEETEIRIAEIAQVDFCFLFESCFQNMLSKNNYCLDLLKALGQCGYFHDGGGRKLSCIKMGS